MKTFLEVFIPLFVTIDAIGLVPVFLGVTGDMDDARRRKVSFEAVASALGISLVFMFIGQRLFEFLYIRTEHFMIAGGVILLVLAVLDIVIMGKPAMHPDQVVGVVPIGTPLIAGPATLSTVLLLSSDARYGPSLTALALAVNMGFLLVVLLLSSRIGRLVGLNALRAFSKLVMVLLAAIAVSFIARGIEGLGRR